MLSLLAPVYELGVKHTCELQFHRWYVHGVALCRVGDKPSVKTGGRTEVMVLHVIWFEGQKVKRQGHEVKKLFKNIYWRLSSAHRIVDIVLSCGETNCTNRSLQMSHCFSQAYLLRYWLVSVCATLHCSARTPPKHPAASSISSCYWSDRRSRTMDFSVSTIEMSVSGRHRTVLLFTVIGWSRVISSQHPVISASL